MPAKHRTATEPKSLLRRLFPNLWAAVWLLAGVSGVLLTYFRTTLEKRPFGWVTVPLSVVFFAAAWLAQRLDKIRSEEEKTSDLRDANEQARQMFVGVSDVLRPLAVLLLDVVDMSCSVADRRNAMGKLRLGCVVAVAELSAPQRARSCLFEFGDDCKTLVPKEHHGRSDVPTSRFNLGADTPYVEIVTMLNTHKAVLYDDVDEQPPQGWDRTHTPMVTAVLFAPPSAPSGTSTGCSRSMHLSLERWAKPTPSCCRRSPQSLLLGTRHNTQHLEYGQVCSLSEVNETV